MRSINLYLLLATLPFAVLSARAQMPPPGPPPAIPPELLNQSIEVDQSVAKTAAASARVSPQKKALILEYMQLSGKSVNSEPQFGQLMDLLRTQLPSMTKQISVSTPELASAMVARIAPGAPELPHLTDIEKKEITEKAQESVARMVQRSGELMQKNKELPQIAEDTFVSVYDKYFSEQDLKDLIAFYHTPIGEKLRLRQPAIEKEIMTLTITGSSAPIGKVMQQVQQEEALFAPDKVPPRK
ncbi:hypothetical protein BH11CYA1_BH11CYA1_06120 [soil metagenome]